MSDYSIHIVDTPCHFEIKKEGASDTPVYATESFFYGCDYGEDDSSLAITADLNTCEVLHIRYAGVFCGMETVYLDDCCEYDDLKVKPKVSFIPPRGAEGIGRDYIRDFTLYYSKERIKILLEDGEPYFRYHDDRLTIYYDDDYNLLTIFINDITKEEFESLQASKEKYRLRRH